MFKPKVGFQVGNMVADPRPLPLGTPSMTAGVDGQGNVYHGFTHAGTHVYVAVSRNFGTTWTDTKVFDAPSGMTCDHIFTWVAVDDAGNVLHLRSPTTRTSTTRCPPDIRTSKRRTGPTPVRVSSGPYTKSSAIPDDGGRIGRAPGIQLVRQRGHRQQDANAQWCLLRPLQQRARALSPTGRPVLEQVPVSDHIVHEGALCQSGTLGCSGTRARC
jgi:hypothetical protein